MKRIITLIAILTICSLQPSYGNEDLDTLASWLPGTYSSLEHSRRDPAYEHLTLHISHIWPERDSTAWFYTEIVDADDEIRGQTIYQIAAVEEGMFEIIPFLLRNAADVVGGWKHPEQFDTIAVRDLVRERNCELYLQFSGTSFFGSTHGTACKCAIEGASYMTKEIEIRSYGVMMWERAYTASDELIWGPPKSGYVFLREAETEGADTE